VRRVEITSIFTLSLILPIPAKTNKLKTKRLLQIIKILLIESKVPLKRNLVQKIISANSFHKNKKRIAKLKLKREKYV